ncbi:hypothetical protein ACFLV7_16065 [Chloroflexota bacterium]
MLGILRMLGESFAFAPRNESMASKEQMLKLMLGMQKTHASACKARMLASKEQMPSFFKQFFRVDLWLLRDSRVNSPESFSQK